MRKSNRTAKSLSMAQKGEGKRKLEDRRDASFRKKSGVGRVYSRIRLVILFSRITLDKPSYNKSKSKTQSRRAAYSSLIIPRLP